MVMRAKTAYSREHGYATRSCWCSMLNAVMNSFEADSAHQITASTDTAVPTKPCCVEWGPLQWNYTLLGVPSFARF